MLEAGSSPAQWTREYEATTQHGSVPRLIEPEILLPSQYYDALAPHVGFEGERRLMLAVLEDAVACYQKHVMATRPRAQRLYQEAEAWLFNEDGALVFSFESVCAVLGIHPEYFRTSLLRWKQRLLAAPDTAGAKVGRVRLRSARRHKILPCEPRRRRKATTERAAA